MEQKEYKYCLRCGRKLKRPEARQLGFGKICYEKQRKKFDKVSLFKVEEKSDAKSDTPIQ